MFFLIKLLSISVELHHHQSINIDHHHHILQIIMVQNKIYFMIEVCIYSLFDEIRWIFVFLAQLGSGNRLAMNDREPLPRTV